MLSAVLVIAFLSHYLPISRKALIVFCGAYIVVLSSNANVKSDFYEFWMNQSFVLNSSCELMT